MLRLSLNSFLSALIGVLVVAIVSVTLAMVFNPTFMKQPNSYTIPNLPYVGEHNNLDRYRQPHQRNQVSAAIIAVLEYWYPSQIDLGEVDNVFKDLDVPLSALVVDTRLQVLDVYDQVSVQQATLQLDELDHYLNPDRKTPLIISLPLSAGVLDGTLHTSPFVLTGVNYQTETLFFDNYWLGADIPMTFAEFENRQSLLPAEQQGQFVVINPRGDSAAAHQFSPPGTYNRVRLSAELRDIFTWRALAELAYASGEYEQAVEFYGQLVGHPGFETEVAPAFKVLTYSRYGESLHKVGKLDKAEEALRTAISFNQGLTEPFSYLGSYDYLFENNAEGYRDQLSLPYIILGDLYRNTGRDTEAIEAYQQALAIFPAHVGPREAMRRLQTPVE